MLVRGLIEERSRREKNSLDDMEDDYKLIMALMNMNSGEIS